MASSQFAKLLKPNRVAPSSLAQIKSALAANRPPTGTYTSINLNTRASASTHPNVVAEAGEWLGSTASQIANNPIIEAVTSVPGLSLVVPGAGILTTVKAMGAVHDLNLARQTNRVDRTHFMTLLASKHIEGMKKVIKPGNREEAPVRVNREALTQMFIHRANWHSTPQHHLNLTRALTEATRVSQGEPVHVNSHRLRRPGESVIASRDSTARFGQRSIGLPSPRREFSLGQTMTRVMRKLR